MPTPPATQGMCGKARPFTKQSSVPPKPLTVTRKDEVRIVIRVRRGVNASGPPFGQSSLSVSASHVVSSSITDSMRSRSPSTTTDSTPTTRSAVS